MKTFIVVLGCVMLIGLCEAQTSGYTKEQIETLTRLGLMQAPAQSAWYEDPAMTLVLGALSMFVGILYIALPFAVFGVKKRLDMQNAILQNIYGKLVAQRREQATDRRLEIAPGER